MFYFRIKVIEVKMLLLIDNTQWNLQDLVHEEVRVIFRFLL